MPVGGFRVGITHHSRFACLGRYVLAVLALLGIMTTASALAETRVALVIGNGQYDRLGKLPNPENDAKDIAAALRGMKFQVVDGIDLSGRAFRRAVSEFSRLARDADIALFYYSGHGLQFQSENYLIPVDAELDYELALNETMALDDVIRSLSGAKTSLIYIDACRSFPIEDTFLAEGNERISVIGGLAKPDPDEINNSFVGFSASAGKTASDGSGRNSPFTSAMLEYLPQRGLDVNVMFSEVIDRVRTATEGAQVPQGFNGIAGRLLLVEAEQPTSPPDEPTAAERDFDRAARFDTIQGYLAFLSAHPGGLYAELAKARISQLEQAEADRPKQPDLVPDPAPPDRPTDAEQPTEPSPPDAVALAAQCDAAAADPYDPDRVGPGVAASSLDADVALVACREAIEAAGETVAARLIYQLGRAQEKAGDIAGARQSYETASASSVEAKSALARFLREGAGGSLSLERAATMFSEAAEGGSISAMYFYARMFETGQGKINKDEEAASDWYKRSAEADYPPALNNLGAMYRDGRGVAKNMTRAMQLFDRARARHFPSAAYNLAWLLDVADGVSRNSKQSAQYFVEALASRDPRFVEALQNNGRFLSVETRLALQQALKDAGFYSGGVDGKFGPATNRAIALAGGQE